MDNRSKLKKMSYLGRIIITTSEQNEIDYMFDLNKLLAKMRKTFKSDSFQPNESPSASDFTYSERTPTSKKSAPIHQKEAFRSHPTDSNPKSASTKTDQDKTKSEDKSNRGFGETPSNIRSGHVSRNEDTLAETKSYIRSDPIPMSEYPTIDRSIKET